MFNLGVLENRKENLDQARHWYQQAIITGHPDHGTHGNGQPRLPGRTDGDSGQARHWYQQAITTGHPDQAP